MNATEYDVIIIGGGHNGLTCGAYLARAGKKVLVLERRHLMGGMTVTEEFAPGFRTSTFSYVMSLLHPRVITGPRVTGSGADCTAGQRHVLPPGQG